MPFALPPFDAQSTLIAIPCRPDFQGCRCLDQEICIRRRASTRLTFYFLPLSLHLLYGRYIIASSIAMQRFPLLWITIGMNGIATRESRRGRVLQQRSLAKSRPSIALKSTEAPFVRA